MVRSDRRRIELHEHESTLLDLDYHEVRELVRHAGSALTVTHTAEPGRVELRAHALVGAVTTPHLEIRIRPKIPLENVFLLLEPTRVPLDMRSERIGFGSHDDLTTALATFYARLVTQTLQRGLRRDYERHDDRLVALRGRVALHRQVRSPTPTPMHCTFDEYTEDIPLNRLLKAAATRLLRLGPIGQAQQDTLRHLLLQFGEVGDQPPPVRPLLARGFDRLNAHYEPAARLAALILESSSISHDLGITSANAFLLNMNQVFEVFLEERLRHALRGTLQVKGQEHLHLDVDRSVLMRPDLVFYRDHQPVYVGDAKYKLTRDLTGRDSDLYQLLAYATALGVREGVLIHGLADGTDAGVGEINVARADKRLTVKRIDLRGGRQDIDDAVSRLATWLTERIDPLSPAGKRQ